MEQLREALRATLQQTTFDGLPTDEFRALVQNRSRRGVTSKRVNSEAIQIAEHPRSVLTNLIRSQLGSLVDPASDRIGLAFPISGESSRSEVTRQDGTRTLTLASSVDDFVVALVRGAALLGARRMLSLFAGWCSGEPVQHRIRTLLNGDGVLSEALEPIDGVRIESLALSTDQLGEFLPLRRERSPADYLGRIVVTIEQPMAPALFLPGDEDAVQSSWPAGAPELETICQALSLETNTHLSPAFSWHDYGELDACCLTRQSTSWSSGLARFMPRSAPYSLSRSPSTGATELKLDPQAHVQVHQRRFKATLMALNTAGAKTRRAATRWLSSKDSYEALDDRYIDLRIALESLYLRDGSQEMRFRLALTAAWHLGADLSERREIWQLIRNAYDTASGAVHAGEVEFNGQNLELLSKAQKLSRRGILKLLHCGQPEDWVDLILGADFE